MFGWFSYASRRAHAPTRPIMYTSFFSAERLPVSLFTHAYTTEYAPDPSVSLTSYALSPVTSLT